MLPKDMYAAVPPPVKKVGKRPSLLTDEKVKILLSQPETWFVIGQSKTWISGYLTYLTRVGLRYNKEKIKTDR
jgi:hypothetical protein